MLELSLTRLVLLNILSANSLSSLGNKYDVRITLRLGLGGLIVLLLRVEFLYLRLYSVYTRYLPEIQNIIITGSSCIF